MSPDPPSRVGSGHETKRYPQIAVPFERIASVFMETVRQERTYTNCTTCTKVMLLRFGNKATCLAGVFP